MPRKKASQRECVITGNWKMYKTIEEAKQFAGTLSPQIPSSQARVCLAVPFTAIYSTVNYCKEISSTIGIGAQNMNDATEGAFTGEIAAKMLKEAGAEFVILGHSERRHLFNESDEFINKKVKRALTEGLQPVLCVGETCDERDAGKMHEVVEKQLLGSLEGVSDLGNLMLAYEPVWAIGTGKTATPDDAEEAHLFCRTVIAKKWGEEAAAKLVIQYGGSVKGSNAKELLREENVDGLLVGGASLSPQSFLEIVNSVDI